MLAAMAVGGLADDLAAAPRILENDLDHALATWHRVVIVVWRRETSPSAIERLGLAMLVLERAIGHSVGLFMVVEQGAPLPSNEARSTSATVLQKASLALSAVTFEGAGFRAAAVRAVVTGIGLLAKAPYPYKSFAQVEEAAAWVHLRTSADGEGPSVPEKALLLAVNRVRQAAGP
jgi:hypothetical protein